MATTTFTLARLPKSADKLWINQGAAIDDRTVTFGRILKKLPPKMADFFEKVRFQEKILGRNVPIGHYDASASGLARIRVTVRPSGDGRGQLITAQGNDFRRTYEAMESIKRGHITPDEPL